MATERSTGVRATQTSFRILEALQELDGAGVTTLANHLDVPKSTVHNHLQTLHSNEYVVRTDDTYDVGLRFLQLGAYARERTRVFEVAKPEVEKLAQESKEMANLLVEEHGRGVFLHKANGSEAVHLDTHAGKRVPLHTVGLGKAILAHLSEEHVDEIVDRHGLDAYTPNTITDRDALREELATIRERGFAHDNEERLSGLRCVSAPILTTDGVVGAVSVSGPKNRMRGRWFDSELPELVMSAANVIELNLTYS